MKTENENEVEIKTLIDNYEGDYCDLEIWEYVTDGKDLYKWMDRYE